jgi:hypothetical protein
MLRSGHEAVPFVAIHTPEWIAPPRFPRWLAPYPNAVRDLAADFSRRKPAFMVTNPRHEFPANWAHRSDAR